jgi:hypothetical protein
LLEHKLIESLVASAYADEEVSFVSLEQLPLYLGQYRVSLLVEPSVVQVLSDAEVQPQTLQQ